MSILEHERLGKAARDGFIAAQDDAERKKFELWENLSDHMKIAWFNAAQKAISASCSTQ
jgi:hypothetical protein